jgi:hypothetical protein
MLTSLFQRWRGVTLPDTFASQLIHDVVTSDRITYTIGRNVIFDGLALCEWANKDHVSFQIYPKRCCVYNEVNGTLFEEKVQAELARAIPQRTRPVDGLDPACEAYMSVILKITSHLLCTFRTKPTPEFSGTPELFRIKVMTRSVNSYQLAAFARGADRDRCTFQRFSIYSDVPQTDLVYLVVDITLKTG